MKTLTLRGEAGKSGASRRRSSRSVDPRRGRGASNIRALERFKAEQERRAEAARRLAAAAAAVEAATARSARRRVIGAEAVARYVYDAAVSVATALADGAAREAAVERLFSACLRAHRAGSAASAAAAWRRFDQVLRREAAELVEAGS